MCKKWRFVYTSAATCAKCGDLCTRFRNESLESRYESSYVSIQSYEKWKEMESFVTKVESFVTKVGGDGGGWSAVLLRQERCAAAAEAV